jgi:hypothetical protein
MSKPTTILLTALFLVAGVACGGGGDGGGGARELSDALPAAAEAADEAGSAHVEMTTELSAGDQDITLTADGEFDFANEIGTMTMTAASGAGIPGLGEMEIIFDGRYMYVKGEAFASVLKGKEWGRLDLTSGGATGTNQFNQDPAQYLEWLRGAGAGVEEVGEEDVDGTPTTHYEAEIDVDTIIEQAPNEASAEALRSGFAVFGDVESFPIDVWLDEASLPRRISIEMNGEGEAPVSSTVTIDLSDYGTEVEVEVPESYQEISGLGG